MGRCSSLVLLLTVPLLRSPQDIPPPSYRRPFRSCSMADESRQRCHLAEDRKGAILSHWGRERAYSHACTGVFLTYPRRTPQPTCVRATLLHGFVECQIIFPFILPQSRQLHTTTYDTLVLCPCIYNRFIRCLLVRARLQVSGRTKRHR